MHTDVPDTRYLFRMTDSTGLFQHGVSGIPDPTHGYTVDDNARALIVAALLYLQAPEPQYEQLLVRYMSFLLYAEKDGWFRNFMNYNREFIEDRGSDDSFGRCICALCYISTHDKLPRSIQESAVSLLKKTLPSCNQLQNPHSMAYALAGLSNLHNPSIQESKNRLAESLVNCYSRNSHEEWNWFESTVTYCSGIFPFALLRAGHTDGRQHDSLVSTGLESLEFLAKAVFGDGMFKPIGCKGWYRPGMKPAVFDEQPVEACSMLIACREAYRITGERIWQNRASLCYKWYNGKNILGKSVIDQETGGCCDGITSEGLNRNQGAESIVCWLLAALVSGNCRR